MLTLFEVGALRLRSYIDQPYVIAPIHNLQHRWRSGRLDRANMPGGEPLR